MRMFFLLEMFLFRLQVRLSGSCGFIYYFENIEIGYYFGVFSGFFLGVVEIGRNGDDCVLDSLF